MQQKLTAVIAALGFALTACAELDPGDEASADVTSEATGELIAPTTVRVTLARQTGVSGVQRVNFAVPFAKGALVNADLTKVTRTDGVEVPAARRVLASYPDGSIRSVQLQVDIDSATTALDVRVGTARTTTALAMAEVSTTLLTSDGTTGPKVWAYLPDSWLASSQVTGPMRRRADIAGTAADAFQAICDYARYGTTAFNAGKSVKDYWLFDRATGLYRGYAYTGSQSVARDAYKEAAMYRAGITGTGSATRIGVPSPAPTDLKYHYTEGMAIHYLLTGDTRFREAAENVAIRAHDLWLNPSYRGQFWTERHAGFALIAYEWAAAVSDDRAATFAGWADTAVTAYAAMQDNGSAAWETDARCFAHTAESQDEDYGYTGCSPWMSAIVADGLEAYARRNGAGTAKYNVARDAIVELGRMIARHGRDTTGKPYYWMAAGGTKRGEIDDYDEHWGESAYIVSMAWWYQGKTDAALRTAADQLVAGTRTRGETGQLRSFNWQCRASVATPFFLN
jgi:hypothetical protein